MTTQPTTCPVEVKRQRCDERRRSLDRLIHKYGSLAPAPTAQPARDEQAEAKRPA